MREEITSDRVVEKQTTKNEKTKKKQGKKVIDHQNTRAQGKKTPQKRGHHVARSGTQKLHLGKPRDSIFKGKFKCSKGVQKLPRAKSDEYKVT